MKNPVKKLLIAIIIVMITGCAASNEIVPARISQIRGAIPGTEIINVQVNRGQYKKSLENKKAMDQFRLVELMVRGKDSSRQPEHRMFSIAPGSAPELLALKNADVLVAANDFVIHNPVKFKQYLMLLQDEKTAEIEIRREDKPVLLKYTFAD